MIDPELRQKWTAALRSGTYQQGVAVLRRELASGERFCCLGVLCEVMGTPRAEQGYYFDDGGGYIWTGVLPETVLDKVVQANLTERNDTQMPFPEIADYIDAEAAAGRL